MEGQRLPLLWALTRDLNHNPGTCPDQGLNQQCFALQDNARPTEPHQSGRVQCSILMIFSCSHLFKKEKCPICPYQKQRFQKIGKGQHNKKVNTLHRMRGSVTCNEENLEPVTVNVRLHFSSVSAWDSNCWVMCVVCVQLRNHQIVFQGNCTRIPVSKARARSSPQVLFRTCQSNFLNFGHSVRYVGLSCFNLCFPNGQRY